MTINCQGSRGMRSPPAQTKICGQSPPRFSAEKHYGCIWHYLWDLKNYLRSTMKEDRLNNCLLMHCRHKSITDTQDTVKVTKRFACANEQRKWYFGKFKFGTCVRLSGIYMSVPCFKTLRRLWLYSCSQSVSLASFHTVQSVYFCTV